MILNLMKGKQKMHQLKNLILASLRTSYDLGFEGDNEWRSTDYVFGKIAEEIGEIADEIEISLDHGKPGKDGIIGECVDTLISYVDLFGLIYLRNEETKDLAHVSLRLKDLLGIKPDQDLADVSPVYWMKSQQRNLNKLCGLNGELVVAMHVRKGMHYKTTETLGVSNIEQQFDKVIKEGILRALSIIKLELAESIEAKEMSVVLNEIWMKKLNKWRIKRGLSEI